MLKKTFYLFSVLLLFFGVTGCDEGCQNMKSPISWSNMYCTYFKKVELSIDNNYYVVNSSKLDANKKVSPDRPITRFYEIFEHPQFAGVTQNSQVKVASTITDNCFKSNTDNFYDVSISQTYYKIGANPLSSTPRIPGYSYRSYMSIDEGGYDNLQCMNFWVSSRGDRNHTYKIELVSGPYAKGGIDDNWYDLIWNWVGDNSTINSSNLEIMGNNQYAVKSMKVMGAAINVTPNKPFVHHIYLDGALKPCTLENVSIANNLLTLAVKY